MQRLLPFFPTLPTYVELKSLNGITLGSRQVKPNDLFVALKGHQVDGRQFIDQAIKQGAILVLAEADSNQDSNQFSFQSNQDSQQTCLVISVPKLSQRLSEIAGTFFHFPAEKLTLVGITGTNGKTTTAQLLAQWRNLLGGKSAVMGTIGNGLYGQVQEAANTTGSAIEIQQHLAQFLALGADFCAMEVSSHGLVQHRTEALAFDLAIFTNLSRDHLDYHHTMTEYEAAKFRLFNELKVKYKVINADDEIGQKWLTRLPDAVAVSANPDVTLTQPHYLQASSVNYTLQGAVITFDSSWGRGELHSRLIGQFNVINLLTALAGLLVLGFDLQKLVETAPLLTGVCGRMECLTAENKPLVIVDYAHTPDALEKALQAARLHCRGKLWCIFGCGGDRDKGKRPLMAKIAEQLADQVIVTDDNPRTEDPYQIVQDILSGFKLQGEQNVIHDRQQAIGYAIEQASAKDVILIAGKGHEDYQIIGTEKHHFSDQEVALQYLAH